MVLNGRSAERIEDAAAELRGRGRTAHAAAFDVTDFDAVDEAVERIERDIGPIDILINNAGIQHRAPLDEFPEEEWQRLIDTNISGVFHVGKAVARHMIGRAAAARSSTSARCRANSPGHASRPTPQPRVRCGT